MTTGDVTLLTDHSSREGSREVLVAAVELLTGSAPLCLDARHFMTGGTGRARVVDGKVQLEVASEGVVATPGVLIIYEIQPESRRRFEAFQGRLRRFGVDCLGLDAQAWRMATEKDLTVQRFLRDGVAHMETVTLRRPRPEHAQEVFDRLGRDVWARPTVGMGGSDVFHVTTHEQLNVALEHYERLQMDWLIARDARNFDEQGRRHQFRVNVLEGRVLRACEHVQTDLDAPCNEARGAVSSDIPLEDLPAEVARAAIEATRSLGLPFSGVDLAVENGVVVFEVNVHPVFGLPGGPAEVAVPYVEAHLSRLANVARGPEAS